MTSYQVQREELDSGISTRYQITIEERALTFADVVQLWQTDTQFCREFTDVLIASPYAAFRWETPAFTPESRHDPFEFVLINAPEFVARRTDRRTFADRFTTRNEGVVAFPNLSGDATMVVPSPLMEGQDFGHLAAFLRTASAAQTTALWSTIGKQMAARIGGPPVWLNTAGGGVAWLHVRLDSRPKYYHHVRYRRLSK